MSDNTFWPFRPPLGITEAEWKALRELHDGRTMNEQRDGSPSQRSDSGSTA